MQRSKSYRATADTFDQDEVHAPLAAIKIAKAGSKKKFDETVDVVMRLGVDPRKADQMIRGTVTPDVAKAVSDIKGGKIEFRVDRHANLHFIIGKASFTEAQLAENYAAALEEVLRLKPASSKGRYLRKVTLSTTMGPGVQVDPNRVRNVAAEDEA